MVGAPQVLGATPPRVLMRWMKVTLLRTPVPALPAAGTLSHLTSRAGLGASAALKVGFVESLVVLPTTLDPSKFAQKGAVGPVVAPWMPAGMPREVNSPAIGSRNA